MEKRLFDRACHQCGMQLKGRSDKRFCNDSCRTAYHNYHDAIPTCVRSINSLLQRNRKIIINLLGKKSVLKLKSSELIEQGYQSKFCTEIKLLSDGKQASLCYDVGWIELKEDEVLIFQNTEN